MSNKSAFITIFSGSFFFLMLFFLSVSSVFLFLAFFVFFFSSFSVSFLSGSCLFFDTFYYGWGCGAILGLAGVVLILRANEDDVEQN